MTHDGVNTQHGAGEVAKDAVITLASPLPVMNSAHAEILDVQVHANVLALIEAYMKAASVPMPWSTLLAAASAVPADHELLQIRADVTARTAAVVRDAVMDLLSLGLVRTGPLGLDITEAGRELARSWNGEYRRRLEAADAFLGDVSLLPTV